MNAPMFSKRIHNLPYQPTPFFGRQFERAEIVQRLADSNCRLLTLTGTGGIGKTRLAIRAAAEVLDSFAHGVWFVSLQSVNSSELLLTTVADMLNVPFSATTDLKAQLRTYLSDKEMLLLLDNFEQLLEDGGADQLPDLLLAAPALKLLVTSREALKLQEEWVYPIGGMPIPVSDQAEDLESSGVIQLFVERARRVCGDFSLAEEQASVVRVCQLVEGVPLAVELAASWTHVLRCDAIAAEIGRSVQFLHTDVRNIPERHRSMHAVFEQSLQLLSHEERRVFVRLAVFRGGFRREAAAHIAGASLPILATLTRKSLLHFAGDGRYQIHELLRQYAEEQLDHASSEDLTRNRHAAYYLAFLSERDADMNGGRQLQAAAEIAAELDNVRAAWYWAIEHRNIVDIVRAANALYIFYQFRSRYVEGAQLWERAVQALDDQILAVHPDAALLLYELGMLYVRLGRLEHAQVLFERSQTVCQDVGEPPRHGRSSDPRLGLGLVATLRGDYTESQRLMEQVRQTSIQSGHLGNQQTADYYLAGIYLAQGHYQAAQRHAETAYTVAQVVQDRWFMAYCLNELGNAARALGTYEQAQRHYQASYTLREEFGDPEGMAVALTELGVVALLHGNVETAENHYRQSLAIYRDINDQGGLVTALDGLGQALCARGQIRTAVQHFRHALQIATTAQFIALRLSLMSSIGQCLLQNGHYKRGVEVLRIVQQHPATTREARDYTYRLLEPYRDRMSPYTAKHGQSPDLETLTARLQAELAALEAQGDTSSPTGPAARLWAEPLIEPLTPRERELLRLLAAGLSYREIAEQLTIAVGSVKSHSHNIYAKLGVRNRVQAIARAAELGLL
jgi:predicted ATPase/DNA-binding CsgD family transcriptional regulator/uncharacterized protein HemY